MLPLLKKYRLFVGVMLVLSAIIISLFYNALKPEKKLPIYTPSMVNPELVDTTVQHISNEHTIAPFSFTNQNGKTISQKEYENTIYVADFFFTTCPSICPKMTKNMVALQNKIKQLKGVKLVSFSVTPDIDSVPVLSKYAKEKGVDSRYWNLLTGAKKDIYYLARKSFLAVKTNNSSELYDMVHTENFILIDRKKRVRGFYDGTNPEEVAQLYEDILFLVEKK